MEQYTARCSPTGPKADAVVDVHSCASLPKMLGTDQLSTVIKRLTEATTSVNVFVLACDDRRSSNDSLSENVQIH